MNSMNCKGEMWKTRRENLTLRDRGLAEADQGQICLGCVFMHGTALEDASELAAGVSLA